MIYIALKLDSAELRFRLGAVVRRSLGACLWGEDPAFSHVSCSVGLTLPLLPNTDKRARGARLIQAASDSFFCSSSVCQRVPFGMVPLPGVRRPQPCDANDLVCREWGWGRA